MPPSHRPGAFRGRNLFKLCLVTANCRASVKQSLLAISAAADVRPGAGGEGGAAAVPRDAGQPDAVAPLPERRLLLHPHVHRLQRAARRALLEALPPAAGVPVRGGACVFACVCA